ncbi:VOC family protein [Haloactinomyces albus]|uniref:Enzyme related to lactoylglutathione lyase n=1 Tax=Haloactinomyces albus TaxID=1352928 RepID=A0AAE3ZHR4_9ACTN|nr:VOC family protein [Haloactinomyces albus]MDR7303442.1 putative enzyme related to lactoylglutathione lyase [Haloactinomyces albus]
MRVVEPGSSPPRWELYAGMPCWIELVTTDPDRACEFYAGLFGWTYEVHRDHRAGDHVIAFREGFPVASIRTAAHGPSEWRLFLATADAATAVEQAEQHGASVTVPSKHVAGVGTKVVLNGPSEADFGLLQPEASWQFDVGLPGTLMWAELVTIKAQTADLFFHGLFGYTAEQFGTEHKSDYSVWYLGDESVLARVSMVRDHITTGTRPHWLLYLGADPYLGTEEVVRQAIGLEGRVRVDPYDSQLGRVAVLRDPTGARFAVVDQTQAPGDYGSAANYDPYGD